MPSLNRRDLLQLSTAGVGLLVSGEARALAPALTTPPLRGLDEALPHIHDQEQAILRGRSFAEGLPRTVSGWDPDHLLRSNIATALWAGRLHALTPEEREAPGFRAEIERRTRAMSVTLWANAAHMESLDREVLKDYGRQVREDPSLLDGVREQLLAEGRQHGVPEATLARYEAAHRHIAWRLQHEELADISDDLVARVDRHARRHRVDWRHEARVSADDPFVAPEAEAQPSTEETSALQEKAGRQQRSGAILLGVGVPLLVGGTVAGIFAIWPFGFMTIGVVLLIVGAVLLAAAARNRRKIERAAVQ